MQTIKDYIDKLKEITGSDYKSAKILEVDRSVISNIRKRGALSDENALKIADALGIDESEVLLAATIARSDGKVKTAWENLSKRTGIAASVAITCFLGAGELKATEFKGGTAEGHSIHYAKSYYKKDLSWAIPDRISFI